MHRAHASLISVIGVLALPAVLACSACIKELMTPTDFDRRAWDASPNVFVALVTKAEIQLGAGAMVGEISYGLQAEEIFKGEPQAVEAVHSTRTVNRWNDEVQVVGCGDVSVVPGDRLLVFSQADGSAFLGLCSATRVVEGADAPSRAEVSATLARLRLWRTDL